MARLQENFAESYTFGSIKLFVTVYCRSVNAEILSIYSAKDKTNSRGGQYVSLFTLSLIII